jgi:hypothetical protein
LLTSVLAQGRGGSTVRHAKTGDTGDYASSDVEAMAYEVAKANRPSRL